MNHRRSPLFLSLSAVMALASGMVATTVVFLGLRSLEQDRLNFEFRQRAETRIRVVQQQLDDTVQVVKILNKLFYTVQPISREQFHEFTLPLVKRHSYIQAFNFHRYIPEEQRAAYEQELQRLIPAARMMEMSGDTLNPAPARPRHYVVDYIEPLPGNEAALGLDVFNNATLMETVRSATDSGEAAATRLLTLVQGGGRVRGFLVVMPVYRAGMPLDTVEQRRAAMVGDTAAVFNASGLINKILAQNELLDDPSITMHVYAADKPDEDALAFRSGSRPASPAASPGAEWLQLLARKPQLLTHQFDVAGRRWTIQVGEDHLAIPVKTRGSSYALAGGILISILLAAYLHAIARRSRQVQDLVEQRTAQLSEANAMLIDDIAARKRAEEGLQLRHRAIEASPNAVILTSAEAPLFPIEYVNPAFERITGYGPADTIGRSMNMLWGDDHDQPELTELRAAVRELRDSHAILRTYTKSGDQFWSHIHVAPVRDETGNPSHFVVSLMDISATKRYQAELEFQANRDTLTGLANRNLLRDRLAQATAFSQRYGQPVWLLFINLDRFKFINDTLGHKAGDQLLKTMAQRMQDAVRETDTVARLSADEFVMILPERSDNKLVPATIQRIMDAIAGPTVIEGYEFVIGSSVGVAVCPGDSVEPEALIKYAGIAMYRAKETGRNNFQFYTSSMNERAMERLRLEGDLRNAVERGEFVLHYQPQVSVDNNQVVGVEALIRWQHPTLGLVSPARFIQIAEEMGLIVPIGAWVMRTACRQSMAWQREGYGEVRVAVNLSARQFYQQDLATTIFDILQETGLPPHLLELELTESMMMADVEHAALLLRKLKTLGVQLSIDDFGTGYSSLAYLKRFPIDLLKIDQSFVRDITVDPDDAAIVTSIISLAHSLRLDVIAEGVETEAQLAYLRRHGCDYMQGYYFSRPVPAPEVAHMLTQRKERAPALPAVSGRTVLLVDDDVDMLVLLKEVLELEAYEVLVAESAHEALDQLARNEVHVIVSDQLMGGMNGSELLNRVKILYPDVVRLILSGESGGDTVIDAVNQGQVFRYLTKPIDRSKLCAHLRDAFRHHAAMRLAAGQPEAV
ncbi:EAL domain-containing protein [Noviherbaspirillum galbum]|uniref:EAL domain-containing protein n=1 Tax=Noviherbaspirillum galbum TaxID=2709383 RepID=A0A6B3SSB6_9BURK|nr:EAL domain-containing protein [Noviherbaspirillum galbum]NEX60489.1 EAL domain-containing protein [Noviherbaspirillum galbum]